jgi:tetratricopeptide (TPR) repeat protein
MPMRIFNVTRETKLVLIVVISICAISFGIAFLYYGGVNKSEDPRITSAKFMFSRYDEWIQKKSYQPALTVLDSIEQILHNTPGYADSYELGIILNNRASVYLSRALYETEDSLIKRYLLDTALVFTHACIGHYNKWMDQYSKLSEEEISDVVKPYFQENDVAFKGKDYKKIIRKRAGDIVLAQKESPRRLSVAYTNLGIIQRHQFKQKDAIESYITAIRLWKDNPAALGNLNVLYGKPYSDRSTIKKLFPPDRSN